MNEPSIRERQLREALRRQAAQAPDGARIRAALAGAPARNRRGPLMALAAAAVVTAVVVLPALLFAPGHQDDDVAPAATTSPSGFHGIDARVTVEPKWLPAGFRETTVSADHHPVTDLVRTWGNGGSFVSLTVSSQVPALEAGASVSINDAPGHKTGNGSDKLIYTWPQAGKYLTLIGVGVTGEQLTKVAESVVPTERRVSVPLRIGWLPAGTAVHLAEADTTQGWRLTAAVSPGGKELGSVIVVSVTTVPRLNPDPSATTVSDPVTVDGRPGEFVATIGSSDLGPDVVTDELTVPLDGGARLTVRFGPDQHPWTEDDAVRIAESVTYDLQYRGAMLTGPS